MPALILEMLQQGFLNYQNSVAKGPVSQCIHAAHHTSSPWLHLHTFCEGGTLDQMHGDATVNKVYWCHKMQSINEAEAFAKEIVAWAVRLYGPLEEDAPKTCKDMGCEAYGPAGKCSCNNKCMKFGDCCGDYSEVCQ